MPQRPKSIKQRVASTELILFSKKKINNGIYL